METSKVIQALEVGLKAVQALGRQASKNNSAFAEVKFANDAALIKEAIDSLSVVASMLKTMSSDAPKRANGG